jgi:hypothetical protein
MHVHIQGYQCPSPGRKDNSQYDTYNKKAIFSFEQKYRNDEIVDEIVIGSDENQITEFDCHRFSEADGITSENGYPKRINNCPKEKME